MASERSSNDVRSYYDQRTGEYLAGGGLIWFMTADHLSPPLSNQDEYALNSDRWREATSMRVLDLAQRMHIAPGWRVLDLGAGIGGPGRDIVVATGCSMYGVNLSASQIRSLRTLSGQTGIPYDKVVQADMRWLPLRSCTFDAVISINTLYHVPEPARVLAEVERVLVRGGRFGLDDWFLTNTASEETVRRLRNDWSTPDDGFHVFDEIVHLTIQAGLVVDEVVDLSREAGQFLTEERFGATFDSQVAPTLVRVFPELYQYDGYRPDHAAMAVAQLRSDILHIGTGYRSGEVVYRQIVASKPGAK
jgi:ubiquinone/menaquinone biosynthesis C-methylase UbiE